MKKNLKNPQITDLLNKFTDYRILVIGDVMVDSYMWGQVTRISPEAPVPVLTYTSSENRLGGAANVALNIHALGAVPVICSVTGTDENGRILTDLMRNLYLPEEGLVKTGKRSTTIKTRIIAGRQQLIRIDREDDHNLEARLQEELWEKARSILLSGKINAVVFQDYDKGVITQNLIENVIALAVSKNIPTLVDPKKRNFGLYRNATLFKPNYKELVEGLGTEIRKNDFGQIHRAAVKLQKSSGFQMVLVTLSEEGMLISLGKEFRQVPTEVIDVADVSGAGDTVIAVASLCLAAGVHPYDMAQLANLAAGMVCERVGVVPVRKEWLLNANISFTN